MEKTDGEAISKIVDYYREVSEKCLRGDITIDELIRRCTTGCSISVVARVLTRSTLIEFNKKRVEKAKEALEELAKKDTRRVVKEIVRQIVFSINHAERKGRKWNEESLNFLFELLDRERLDKVGGYTVEYINKFGIKSEFEPNLEGRKEYEIFRIKISTPGCSKICGYILRRAKREKEIKYLERIAGPREYYTKNKEHQGLVDNAEMNKTKLCGYLSTLATMALIKKDIELISAYAHFYEFVYFVLRHSELSVFNKNMEEKDFFEIVDKLFENGAKKRVVEVLFEGMIRLKEEGKELIREALKRLIEKDGATFISYYEFISNKNKVNIKELVEDFIIKHGRGEVKKRVFDMRMQAPNGTGQTFINPGALKEKN